MNSKNALRNLELPPVLDDGAATTFKKFLDRLTDAYAWQVCLKIGAIYARYSTKFQASIEDHVRECLEWAHKNSIYVPPWLIFVDRKLSGRLRRRPGRMAMEAALLAGKFKVLICFATNRLERTG